MFDPTDEGSPPLGEPTPLRQHGGAHRPRRPRRRPWLGAAIALVIGLGAGFGLGQLVDGDGGRDGGRDAESAAAAGDDRFRPTPATTAPTVPAECVETIRSAQQALALLEKGLEDLRDFDVVALDSAGREMQRLQQRLDRRVRQCAARIAG